MANTSEQVILPCWKGIHALNKKSETGKVSSNASFASDPVVQSKAVLQVKTFNLLVDV